MKILKNPKPVKSAKSAKRGPFARRPVEANKVAMQANSPKQRPAQKRGSVVSATVLDIEHSFPTVAEMRNSRVRDAMLEFATNSQAGRHQSLRNEMKCIYALATYYAANLDDYQEFRASHAIKKISTEPHAILGELLHEYTGRDTEQKKTASKYKHQLLPSLEKGLSVPDFDKLIEDAGGVFNLEKASEPDEKPADPTEEDDSKLEADPETDIITTPKDRMVIVSTKEVKFRLRPGNVQKLEILNGYEGMMYYVVKVARGPSKIGKELLLTEDDDDLALFPTEST